jgi:hypothetical protein
MDVDVVKIAICDDDVKDIKAILSIYLFWIELRKTMPSSRQEKNCLFQDTTENHLLMRWIIILGAASCERDMALSAF